MNHLFTSYEQALELKKLGFDEPCLASYIETDDRETFVEKIHLEIWSDEDTQYEPISKTKAPLKQQAFKWFRDKHNLVASLFQTKNIKNEYVYFFEIGELNSDRITCYSEDKLTYEEAENACIDKLIETIKK
jgi:hypothetical protein